MSYPRQTSGGILRGLAVAAVVLPAFAYANADVEKNIANSKNWATQAGDMFNQRYSKLKQINKGNVGKMQVAGLGDFCCSSRPVREEAARGDQA